MYQTDFVHTEQQIVTVSVQHPQTGNKLSVQVSRFVNLQTKEMQEPTVSVISGHFRFDEWAVIARMMKYAFETFQQKYGTFKDVFTTGVDHGE